MVDGYLCYGIDFSREMVEAARKRVERHAGRAILFQADAENIPLDSAMFDLVLCIGVLGYLASDEEAVGEIHRVLRPSGYAVLSVGNMMSISNLPPWARRHSRTYFRYRLHHPWRFERALRGSGLELVRAMTFGYQFRLLRRLKLLPELLMSRLEVALERWSTDHRIPYFSYAGEAYIGLFRKTNTVLPPARIRHG